jgi:putative nucleotidyltransferase with HDIG domain
LGATTATAVILNLAIAGLLAIIATSLRGQHLHQIDAQAEELYDEMDKYKQEMEAIRQMAARGETLAHCATRLNSQLDFDSLLNVICEETTNLLHFPAASITLYDKKKDDAWFVASSGLPKEYCKAERKSPRSTFEKNASQMGTVIVIPDVQTEHLADADLYDKFGIRTIGTAAMTHNDELIGGLNIYSFGSTKNLDDNERALFKGLADQAVLAIINARLFSETERHLQQLQALHQIDRAIIGSTDLVLTLNTFIDEAIRLLKVDAISVFLFNPVTLTLDYAAGRGFRTKNAERSTLRAGEGHAGRAVLEQRMVRVPNLSNVGFQSGRAQLLEGEDFVTYFGMPLIVKGEVKGILDVFNRTALEPDQDWLKFLETLAGQAAIAVSSATLFTELQRRNFDLIMAYDTTLEGWSHALDLRDKETEGHTQRVTSMALQLAKAMGLNEFELTHIRRGALLHDIGKMGIPDHILYKHDELNDEERKQIQMHPVYAYEMLAPIEYLHDALDIPYCHHEKWDGSGYPRGLKGEQIPIAARIFAVVDVWDAVTSDRPYRQGWKKQKAIEYIRQNAGSHFDPKLVDTFLRMVEPV